MDLTHIITYFKNNKPLYYFFCLSFLTFLIAFISCLSPDCFPERKKISKIIHKNLLCFLQGVVLIILFSIAFVTIQKQVSPNLIYCTEGVFFGIIISILCIPSEQRKELKVVIPALLRLGESWKGDDLNKGARKRIEDIIDPGEEDGNKDKRT